MSTTYWKSIIEDVKMGTPLIITDSEDRENEGDFFVNASVASEFAIKLMLNEGRGLICTPISPEIANKLDLKHMIEENTANLQTAFTVSVDHISNSTGISLKDRLATIRELANKNSKKADFLRPGHIFPLIANAGGLSSREGHTEAAIELSRLANLPDVGVICEILNRDGTIAKRGDLLNLAKKYNLKIVTIDSLKEYLIDNIKYEKIDFPSEYGHFELYNFPVGEEDIVVLKTKGSLSKSPLVRIHSECKTGDVFSSKRCDCGDQLNFSLKEIGKCNDGLLIYLSQEGRGIGFRNKIKSYKIQENDIDTYTANKILGFENDLRCYDHLSLIFKFFKINRLRLITNNPLKIKSVKAMGINIEKVINTNLFINVHNSNYLMSKIKMTKHTFSNRKGNRDA